MIDDQIIELEAVDGEITINTPTGEAYNDDGSLNEHVSGDYPTLPTGSFFVSWSGTVSSVHITPNWRDFAG
jgi:phage-related protein